MVFFKMIHTIFQNKRDLSSNDQKMNVLTKKSEKILFKSSAVFPFDFFPDEILIDENQVRIVIRRFFLAEQIETILIKDIQWVMVETAPLFGTLTICTFKFGSAPIVINISHYLKQYRHVDFSRDLLPVIKKE